MKPLDYGALWEVLRSQGHASIGDCGTLLALFPFYFLDHHVRYLLYCVLLP
jgi:hypothetical protein